MNKSLLAPASFEIKHHSFRVFFKLWSYLWPKGLLGGKLKFILAFLALLMGKAFVLTTPLFFKYLMDYLASSHTSLTTPLTDTATPSLMTLFLTSAPLLLGAYTLSRVCAGLMNEIRDSLFAVITERAMRQAGVHVFEHLHNLSLSFHLKRQMGSLTQIIQKGIKSIEEFMQYSTFSLIPTLIEVLGVMFIFGYLYGVSLALVCALMLVAYIAATFRITEWRISYIKTMNETDANAHGRAIDSLLNYETVKYFNREDHEVRLYDKTLGVYEKAAVKSKMSLCVLNTAQNIITSMGLGAILWISYTSFLRGSITVGDFVAINTYLFQIFNPLFMVGFAYRQVRLALVNMEAMFTLLTAESDINEVPHAKDLALKDGHIEFHQVSFYYEEERPIFKNLSFEVPAHKTVAIVGLSGAGKSTLSKLLYRFYDVIEGSIMIDGQDIRSITQKSLRASIAIVPQDTVLFNDTLLYNIAYGCPTASTSDIIEASKKAHIHAFIESCPKGYDTLVGERGLKLSGGEKQRVSIARALLKQPKIFIFDEATSSLDTHTEKNIHSQLQDLSTRYTTLMIAHRLSTITHAHNIIVLDKGAIAEQGTHEELLKKDGLYAHMWRIQSKESMT